MLKYFVTFLGACSLAHCQEMYSETGKMNEENGTTHIHIHKSETINSSDQYIARDESAYFASALFKKYNSSDNLSLDGFVRLLCRIGLIPDLADDGKPEADATFLMENQRLPNCGELTFDKVPLTFENLQIDESGLDHEDLDHNDVPNSMKANPSPAHDEADHLHDHKDHDHSHEMHDDEHDHHHHDDQSSHNGDEVGHEHDSDKGKMKRRAVPENSSSDSHLQGQQPKVHVHPTHLKKCISPKELLNFFHIPLSKLNIEQFTLLCPALLYKLDSGNCRHLHAHGQHHHDHDHHGHHHHGEEEEEEVELVALSVVSPKVWGYSTAAVLVISLAGLLGVAVIPIMQKVFYNHLLQFLVAIAVGALSGDALLHLLPHAIAKNHSHKDDSHHAHDHGAQESQEDDHLDAVWKGLIALTCIFFFFLVERILTIVTEKKRRKKAMSRLKKKHCERLCDAEKGGKVGAKLSAHADGDYADCEQMVMVVHPNRALKGYADATHDVVMHQCDESLSQAEHNLDEDNNTSAAVGHTHGHGHGHSHLSSMPGSVAAVAWMVIFGDGIHNFSDGLAIGAAFASGVTGGISTSIAVFCHELPHEIGDFAVLLRAGMSVKQAIVYNCVSSVLCFIGMLVGVAIGNIQNASLWIFAGVGGMFIYISMVDMLPEMTAVDTKKGENHFLHLLLQVGGMMIGSGIMLIIAIFEHDLQILLD